MYVSMSIACAALVVWFYLFHKELLIISCVSRICEVWQINMQIRSSFSSKVLSAWWRGRPNEQLPDDVTSSMVDYCLGSYKRKKKMEPRSTLTPPSIKGTSEKKILRLRVGGVVGTERSLHLSNLWRRTRDQIATCCVLSASPVTVEMKQNREIRLECWRRSHTTLRLMRPFFPSNFQKYINIHNFISSVESFIVSKMASLPHSCQGGNPWGIPEVIQYVWQFLFVCLSSYKHHSCFP